jgi:prepilin-type N-terminal cleavage/methylation domain-containing protein
MNKIETSTLHSQKGFTLIELSIVLVIIGLIVGGVLVGQDLIKAAQIRATVGQIEKYNTAANTFRTKYNGLPGDLANPANFGMAVTTAAAARNGDGLMQSCTANDGVLFSCETAGFWNHLSTASLIEFNVSDVTATAANAAIAAFSTINAPTAKIGGGAFIMVGAPGIADTVATGIPVGFNYFLISGPTLTSAGAVITGTNPLTPLQAYNIDTKFDDGIPTSGIVAAYDNGAAAGGAFAVGTALTLHANGAGFCQNGANLYNLTGNSGADANKALCSLAIRTSF